MKLLYEAANSLEAHMILNLLEQAGLHARIDGEYLQGGVGELQTMGLIRVMVAEADYNAAKKIVDVWDEQQPEVVTPKRTKKPNHFISAALGFLAGAFVVAIIYNTPVTTAGIDYTGDGKLDEKWTYIGDRISKQDIDRNRDGKTDFIAYYDIAGLLESLTADENFDGNFETESYYKNGNMVWTKSDTTGDGFKNYRIDFQHGVAKRITFYHPTTKQPVKTQHRDFNLVSSELDTDGDGTFDTQYEYDDMEEITRKTHL